MNTECLIVLWFNCFFRSQYIWSKYLSHQSQLSGALLVSCLMFAINNESTNDTIRHRSPTRWPLRPSPAALRPLLDDRLLTLPARRCRGVHLGDSLLHPSPVAMPLPLGDPSWRRLQSIAVLSALRVHVCTLLEQHCNRRKLTSKLIVLVHSLCNCSIIQHNNVTVLDRDVLTTGPISSYILCKAYSRRTIRTAYFYVLLGRHRIRLFPNTYLKKRENYNGNVRFGTHGFSLWYWNL